MLPAMTSDHYVGIYLLRYSSMLTSARIGRIRLVSWAGPDASLSIPLLLELRLPLLSASGPDRAGVYRHHIQ